MWGDYRALSYTWGDPRFTCEIKVNGLPMRVTKNLEWGLKDLRDKQYVRDGWKLWIDALCINQNDFVERAAQVKRTLAIYSKAWTPIIWLGPSEDDSDAVIDLIRHISSTYTKNDQVNALTSVLRQDSKAFGEGRWRAMHQFLLRRYWRRVWILQEASIGRDNMPVLCGKQTIAYVELYRTFTLLIKTDEVINKYMKDEVEEAGSFLDLAIWHSLFVVCEIHKHQDEQLNNNPTNLYRMMSLSLSIFSTDARDKIYGLLALMNDNITQSIVPDYAAPVSKVYTDFVKSVMDGTNSLEIFRHARHLDDLSLPSWLPNWAKWGAAETVTSLALSNKLHRTSGTSLADVRYLDGDRIVVKGFQFDGFDGMGCLWSEGWSPDTVEQSKSTSNPYGSAGAVREAIWRTMIVDRDIWGEPLADNYSSLLDAPTILDREPQLTEADPLKALAQSNILEWGAKFLKGNSDLKVCGAFLSSYLPTSFENGKIDARILIDALMARDRINIKRRMITTRRGYVGMALEEVLKDDIICVLLGCSMPMVLRSVGLGSDGEIGREVAYKIVGECYIHGIMGGEAMKLLDTNTVSVRGTSSLLIYNYVLLLECGNLTWSDTVQSNAIYQYLEEDPYQT